MKTPLFLLILGAGLLGACHAASYPTTAKPPGEYDIDSISRNVTETQGGAIRDPYSLAPPPVRRDYYAQER